MRINYIDEGDCLDKLKDIQDQTIDLVIADPPYGIRYSSGRIKDKSRRLGGIINDEKPFIEFIAPCFAKLKPTGAMFIFTRWDVQQKFIDEISRSGGRVKSVCIWDKGTHGMGDIKASYGSRYESILFVPGKEFRFPGKRPQDVIQVKKVPPARLKHPNEKPCALIEKLIDDTTAPGDIVLDPFMGCGTVPEACLRQGRAFIGFEKDHKYYIIAQQRIREIARAMSKEENHGV